MKIGPPRIRGGPTEPDRDRALLLIDVVALATTKKN
jgi:hypothetical protein